MPPRRDSNSVIKRTHVPIDKCWWIFEELGMRIGIKEAISWVGCGYPTWYNWKHRRFWRVDRRFVKAALTTLMEVRREQDGWSKEEALRARRFIQATRQSIRAKDLVKGWDLHDLRNATGQFIPVVNDEAVAARLSENAIDLEEYGREELAKRAVERAEDSAKSNGVVREVPQSH